MAICPAATTRPSGTLGQRADQRDETVSGLPDRKDAPEEQIAGEEHGDATTERQCLREAHMAVRMADRLLYPGQQRR